MSNKIVTILPQRRTIKN